MVRTIKMAKKETKRKKQKEIRRGGALEVPYIKLPLSYRGCTANLIR